MNKNIFPCHSVYSVVKIYILLVSLCALYGKFIVKNGAAAHTLFMQNKPNFKTISKHVTPCYLKPNASSLKPVEGKKQTQTNPIQSQFDKKRTANSRPFGNSDVIILLFFYIILLYAFSPPLM